MKQSNFTQKKRNKQKRSAMLIKNQLLLGVTTRLRKSRPFKLNIL